jgi:hypothetical protein
MTSILSIFRREFAAKRDFLLVAVAAAAIAYLLPYLPGLAGQSPGSVRSVASVALGLGLGWVLAAGLGAAVFGSDLSAGRLGFYFARPVSAASVWAGRMLGVLAIVVVCELIVSIVAVVVEGPRLLQLDGEGWGAVVFLFLVVPTVLLLVSHALSIMLNARTAWLFLDLAALLAIGVSSWLTVRPLVLNEAVKAVTLMGSLLVGAAAVALATAGLAGTAVGRTDVRRTHGALSVTLWLVLGVLVAGAAAYGTWLRDFGPEDLNRTEVLSVAPDGRWIEVAGSAPGRLDVTRRFLISTSDGRWIALPASARNWYDTRYSADGSTAAIFEARDFDGNLRTLWWSDLRDRDPRLRETKIVVTGWVAPHLAPDGAHLAFLSEGVLSVYELENERLVKAISIPENLRNATVFFSDNSRLLLFARRDRVNDAPLRIAEADLDTGKVAELGRIEGLAGRSWVAVDAEVQHVVVTTANDEDSEKRRQLYDARTGALIRELDLAGTLRFLADGRIVAVSSTESERNLLVAETVDGSVRVEHDLGVAPDLGIYGEAVTGCLVVGRLEDPKDREMGRTMDLMDVETGQTRHIADSLRRGYFDAQIVWGPGITVFWYQNAPEAGRFFEDRTGAIVRWDPETGALERIVGGTP